MSAAGYRETIDAAPVRSIARPPAPRGYDVSRVHAVNMGASVGIIAFFVAAIGAIAATFAGLRVSFELLGLLILTAIGAGAIAGAVSLIRYTLQHRAWLYRLEELTGLDIDQDGVTGEPGAGPVGVLVRGIDGAYHRIDVTLSEPELQAVRVHLLTAGAFGVRAVNSLLGDETRASALRVELHRLGILEAPRPRVVTAVTPAGRKALIRWAL